MAKSQQKVVGQSLLYATPAVADESWKAALSLSFESGPSRTVVRREHTGPLTVQRPFYPEGSVAHVYLLHPPGGVVGGDALTINARVSEHAAGLVTHTRSYQVLPFNGSCCHRQYHAGRAWWFAGVVPTREYSVQWLRGEIDDNGVIKERCSACFMGYPMLWQTRR